MKKSMAAMHGIRLHLLQQVADTQFHNPRLFRSAQRRQEQCHQQPEAVQSLYRGSHSRDHQVTQLVMNVLNYVTCSPSL